MTADPDPAHVAYPRSARRRGRPVVRVAGMARSGCLGRGTKTAWDRCMLVASQTISPKEVNDGHRTNTLPRL